MNIRKVRRRYTSCLDQVNSHFRRGEPGEPKAVHEFRVNLKRVDGLMALLAWKGLKLSSRYSRSLKSLFRKVGKLRAIQVEFGVISRYFNDASLNPNYLHQLHEEKTKRLKHYRKFLRKGPSRLIRKAMQKLLKMTRQVDKKCVNDYLKFQDKRTSKLLARNLFREQRLHDVRKSLKRYHLNLIMAGRKNEKIATLQDLLGQWHDLQVAFDHIVKAIYTSGFTPPENKAITTIKGELVRDKLKLYERIVSFYAEPGWVKLPETEATSKNS